MNTRVKIPSRRVFGKFENVWHVGLGSRFSTPVVHWVWEGSIFFFARVPSPRPVARREGDGELKARTLYGTWPFELEPPSDRKQSMYFDLASAVAAYLAAGN